MRKVQNVTQLKNEAEEAMTIDKVIPLYAEHKAEEKRIKDLVTKENTFLKDALRKEAQKSKDGKANSTAGGYTVTLSIEDTSTMNEEKLIEWLKQNNLAKGIVKKMEYVDSDALENAIWNGKITEEQVADMDQCKDAGTKEVLRIKKCKEEK